MARKETGEQWLDKRRAASKRLSKELKRVDPMGRLHHKRKTTAPTKVTRRVVASKISSNPAVNARAQAAANAPFASRVDLSTLAADPEEAQEAPATAPRRADQAPMAPMYDTTTPASDKALPKSPPGSVRPSAFVDKPADRPAPAARTRRGATYPSPSSSALLPGTPTSAPPGAIILKDGRIMEGSKVGKRRSACNKGFMTKEKLQELEAEEEAEEEAERQMEEAESAARKTETRKERARAATAGGAGAVGKKKKRTDKNKVSPSNDGSDASPKTSRAGGKRARGADERVEKGVAKVVRRSSRKSVRIRG